MVFQMSVIRTAIYAGCTANTGTKDTFPGNEQQTDAADAADAVRHRVGYEIPPACRLLILVLVQGETKIGTEIVGSIALFHDRLNVIGLVFREVDLHRRTGDLDVVDPIPERS